MVERGIEEFTFHVDDPGWSATADGLRGAARFRHGAGGTSDEAVAIAEMLVRRSFEGAGPGVRDSFAALSVRVDDRGGHVVRLRQLHAGVPVCGSLAVVELDGAGGLISLHRRTGRPDASPRPRITEDRARDVVTRAGGAHAVVDATLSFYFEAREGRWRLVYLFDDVPARTAAEVAPSLAAYVVDAHDAELVDVITRWRDRPTDEMRYESMMRTTVATVDAGGALRPRIAAHAFADAV